ncbi:protein-tyrosine phosphatase family protein [Streptomyces sp. ODS28]|uniref:protein-tyrosine phosphatase family protein n=1 Tax=Streptomyces sp. ODS28 TaxID=3136688 RepID=UPI0031E6A6FF
MTTTWDPAAPGVMPLPSGALVRGRGLRHGEPGGPAPELGVYLLGKEPDPTAWESLWVRWPDFRLPADRGQASRAFREAREQAPYKRVEFACGGGIGRTGTALACVAVLDGVPADEAVAYVRRHYHPRAVETPWQRRYVRGFGGG